MDGGEARGWAAMLPGCWDGHPCSRLLLPHLEPPASRKAMSGMPTRDEGRTGELKETEGKMERGG